MTVGRKGRITPVQPITPPTVGLWRSLGPGQDVAEKPGQLRSWPAEASSTIFQPRSAPLPLSLALSARQAGDTSPDQTRSRLGTCSVGQGQSHNLARSHKKPPMGGQPAGEESSGMGHGICLSPAFGCSLLVWVSCLGGTRLVIASFLQQPCLL